MPERAYVILMLIMLFTFIFIYHYLFLITIVYFFIAFLFFDFRPADACPHFALPLIHHCHDCLDAERAI